MNTNFSQCGRFPLLVDLNISDINWQVTNTSNGTFYLFNAYYDDREGLQNGTVIRILALINKIDPIVKTFCQMWFEDSHKADISVVINYEMIWQPWWELNLKGASAYLISCKIPQNRLNQVPKFVSLTEDRCGFANNVMEVKNKKPTNGHKKHFIVSVKQLDFMEDISIQLIEWLEILKILGVDKVEIFIARAHVNVKKILKFYEITGFVVVKFIKFPRELPNTMQESWHQYRHNQLICYQDSFYENLYMYEYIVPLDIDEIILPVRNEDKTWKDLMKRVIENSKILNKELDCFISVNRYFLLKNIHENETYEGIPKNLRFLSNIYRAQKDSPVNTQIKTFMRTDRILMIHNHYPINCFKNVTGDCSYFIIDTQDGFLAHYRDDCDDPECKESKLNPVKDTTLWKYKEEILMNVYRTIENYKTFREVKVEN
ncbi:hypothetical protein PVAND_015340 [Polypedilum vanderplanki]|uniref:Glycosyltransferase family 92 protein n=1 Tax=Polypedilum vanderplanki TaxID=319348 RepID=A0A9J6BCB7_POLVA|nr:hypothetical protein PVAND_015340 [Polypedilum vanderplanki]